MGDTLSRRQRADQRVLEYRRLSATGALATLSPKRPRQTRTVLAIVVAATAIAVGTAWFMWAFVTAYVDHDRIEMVDDPVVVDRVLAACAEMNDELASLAEARAEGQARTAQLIRAENKAVASMVSDVRALGHQRLSGDRPTEAWLADWETLVRAREDFSRSPDLGEKAFRVPIADGEPIAQRMDTVGLCPVPTQLTAQG